MQHDTSEFIEVLSQEHTPTQQINDISPELIEVFTKIQPIYKDMEQIYNVLAPLDRQIYIAMEREKEILSKLNTITDSDERWKLSQEFQSLRKLELEIGAEMLKLQDKVKPFKTELIRILSEYGFQSLREFETMHIKSYKTWMSEQ